jgi:hypothetical protein
LESADNVFYEGDTAVLASGLYYCERRCIEYR